MLCACWVDCYFRENVYNVRINALQNKEIEVNACVCQQCDDNFNQN